jgi:chromosome segregation ATPase
MSETDDRSEPHVSTDELRAALAPRGESRRNPVLVTEHPEHAAGEILELRDALDAARAGESELRVERDAGRRAIDRAGADAIELRAALEAARGDAAELRAELATARADLRERRSALERLAGAGAFRRRRVLADLSSRGLV